MSALPDHVQRIVAEIETEIGEEPSLTPIDGDRGRRLERRHDATGNGAVEAAVREILVGDRRGPRSRRAWSARRTGSTGCTPS